MVVKRELLAKDGFDEDMVLRESGKGSKSAYINVRVEGLDRKTIKYALSGYQYIDTKGNPKNYTYGDLKYDIKGGVLNDPREGAASGMEFHRIVERSQKRPSDPRDPRSKDPRPQKKAREEVQHPARLPAGRPIVIQEKPKPTQTTNEMFRDGNIDFMKPVGSKTKQRARKTTGGKSQLKKKLMEVQAQIEGKPAAAVLGAAPEAAASEAASEAAPVFPETSAPESTGPDEAAEASTNEAESSTTEAETAATGMEAPEDEEKEGHKEEHEEVDKEVAKQMEVEEEEEQEANTEAEEKEQEAENQKETDEMEVEENAKGMEVEEEEKEAEEETNPEEEKEAEDEGAEGEVAVEEEAEKWAEEEGAEEVDRKSVV